MMLANPHAGDRVELRYNPRLRPFAPHGRTGVVAVAGRGRPRNHLIKLDDCETLVVVPCGQLTREQDVKMLKLSEDLSLPLDFVTQTQAILAKKRVGKSYTASVQAEELLKAKQQIVVIDVTGAWWGLRSSADGKGAGFPILVAGGDHGDIPLEEGAGELMASAIVGERFSAILDLSLFRKGAALRFLASFFENIYRLNREAVHLFADEADFYCPQKPYGIEDARTIGALDDIVRRGGIRGIGCTLITQRPAVLNANVRTQCGILTALRLSHPLDIKAIMEWVNVHADPGDAAEMMKSLPSLPIGTAWVWAPGWPDERGIFKRVKIRERETFDSGATPKAGETAKRPKVLAPVDVEKLGAQIKATVEKAKADDPKELHRMIAELQKQLREKPNAAPVSDRFDEGRAAGAAEATREIIHRLREPWSQLDLAREKVENVLGVFRQLISDADMRPVNTPAKPVATIPKTIPASVAPPAEGLDRHQQAILDTIAMLGVRGIQPGRDCVARWLNVHPNNGRYGTNLAFLREHGYLEGFTLTARGQKAARKMPTGVDAALDALDDEHKRFVLRTVIEAGGNPLSRDELAGRLNVHPNNGRYGTNLAWLRTMGIITERGPITATEGLHR